MLNAYKILMWNTASYCTSLCIHTPMKRLCISWQKNMSLISALWSKWTDELCLKQLPGFQLLFHYIFIILHYTFKVTYWPLYAGRITWLCWSHHMSWIWRINIFKILINREAACCITLTFDFTPPSNKITIN